MENELEIKRVPFMGAELMAARDTDGQIWAGVSYICNGIGLNKNEKDRQVKNVQTDRVLKKGCVKFDAGVFDPNNQTVAIKLDFVPLWLAKISITPTMEAGTPYLAERLEAYQLQAKDILAAAFLPVNSVPALDTLSPELRLLINLELKQKEQDKAIEAVNQKVDGIRDVVVLNPNSWRPVSAPSVFPCCWHWWLRRPCVWGSQIPKRLRICQEKRPPVLQHQAAQRKKLICPYCRGLEGDCQV